MARFVIFPGTAGSYADTPDENVVDADTAHSQQSVGNIIGLTGFSVPALETAPDASFGSFATKLTTTGGGDRQISIGAKAFGTLIAVEPSTEYTITIRYKIDVQRNYRYFVVGYDVAEVSSQSEFGSYVPVPSVDGFNDLTFTLTTDVDVVWLEPTLQIQGTQVGDNHWIDVSCVRLGSVATFVPSLRIVGVADTTADYAPVVWTGVGGDQSITYFGEEIIHTIRSSSRLNFSYPGSVAATRIPTVPLIDGTRHTIRWYSDPAAGFKVFIDSVFEADIGAAYTPDFSGIGAPPNSAWAIGGRPRAGITPMTGDVWSVTQRDGIDGPIVAVFDAEDIGL